MRTLFDPLAVIDNPSSWLKRARKENFDAAARALKDLMLMSGDAFMERRPKEEITFNVRGEDEPLSRLSEGYKTTVATGVDIMREMLAYWPSLENARGLVLIDEIDTHLHPRWKMRIFTRLRRSMPRVQFIATTHDPLTLRGLDDGEAQVLKRDPDCPIERVEELPNVRGMSVEDLLMSTFFGLHSTEDPRFDEDVVRLATLASKRQRTPAENDELVQKRSAVDSAMMSMGETVAERISKRTVPPVLLQEDPRLHARKLRRARLQSAVLLTFGRPPHRRKRARRDPSLRVPRSLPKSTKRF